MYCQHQQEDSRNKTQLVKLRLSDLKINTYVISTRIFFMTELGDQPRDPTATCTLELSWLPVRLLKEELEAQIP